MQRWEWGPRRVDRPRSSERMPSCRCPSQSSTCSRWRPIATDAPISSRNSSRRCAEWLQVQPNGRSRPTAKWGCGIGGGGTNLPSRQPIGAWQRSRLTSSCVGCSRQTSLMHMRRSGESSRVSRSRGPCGTSWRCAGRGSSRSPHLVLPRARRPMSHHQVTTLATPRGRLVRAIARFSPCMRSPASFGAARSFAASSSRHLRGCMCSRSGLARIFAALARSTRCSVRPEDRVRDRVRDQVRDRLWDWGGARSVTQRRTRSRPPGPRVCRGRLDPERPTGRRRGRSRRRVIRDGPHRPSMRFAIPVTG